MVIFGLDRSKPSGCFAVFDYDVSKSQGVTLRLPKGEWFPRQGGGAIVCTKVTVQDNERYAVKPCFDQRIYTYGFGRGVGEISLEYVIFGSGGVAKTLGRSGGARTIRGQSAVKDFFGAYDKSRLSQSGAQAILSFGGGMTKRGIITGMEFSTVSTELNMFGGRLQLMMVDSKPFTASAANGGGGSWQLN